MNTPRTKPPKRYVVPPTADLDQMEGGIQDQKFASYIGTIITTLPFLEEQMIELFAELTGITDFGSARLVFRSIINQKTRVDVMRAMLEKAPQHQSKTSHFDELLDEFSALSNLRNKYAHGLWLTSKDKKRFFLQEATDTYAAFQGPREINEGELTSVVIRTAALLKKLQDRGKQLALADALMRYEPPPQPPSG